MKLVGVWHTRANNNYNIENVALILLEGDKRLSTYKKKPKELFTKELEINYSSVKSYLIYRGYYFSDIERLADQEELPNEREHFARQCPNNPNLVRFFPTLTHAIQNKYVDIKPGRYYADHFGIDPAVASATWRKLFVSSDLLFATTTKEIEEVYTTGPSSCMAHSRTEYRYNDGKHHPTAVYGDGSDLAVAYTKRYGKINSRAVCWPEKKIYNRLYGDVEILRDLLHKAVYKPGHFYGAKLARLPYKLGFVMPYIDNHSCVRDDETHLTIVEEPTPIPARSQYGAVAMGVECQ